MALGSRSYIIGGALVAVLTADTDLSAYAFALRKKPYNRTRKWQSGGWVVPLQSQNPYHENVQDEKIYRYLIAISDQADGDLVANMERHLGAMERVEEIFAGKAHANMPASLRVTGQAALDAAVAASKFAECKIQATDAEWGNPFVDSAFEGGYDASSVVVSVRVLMSRRNSSAL